MSDTEKEKKTRHPVSIRRQTNEQRGIKLNRRYPHTQEEKEEEKENPTAHIRNPIRKYTLIQNLEKKDTDSNETKTY